MSTKNEADEMMMCCASCGIAAVDEVKLMTCACNLVKYCSVNCQKIHRPQHKKMCRKRLAELRDDVLMKQPDESHLGDCPICCLPLPVDRRFAIMDCCSKRICRGCMVATQKREAEGGLEPRCVYCREPVPKSDEERNKQAMERIKKNDPSAMGIMAKRRYDIGDYETAFQYWKKAAELGDADAHHNLSVLYRTGEGVQKDTKKQIYHLEEAAIGGHHMARFNLGIEERNNRKFERAVKHFTIAANLGHHQSTIALREIYAKGYARKEDYTTALRGYQVAEDAMKSRQRDEAEAYVEEAIKIGLIPKDWK